MTDQEAKKLFASLPEVFLAYSRLTNMPYVEEGENTAADQVYLFSTKEEIQNFGLKKQEEKTSIMAMWYEKKTFPLMFTVLWSIGVDTVVFTQGEEVSFIPLEYLVKEPDYSRLEENKRPLFNPRLQLCSLYFFQTLRRPDRDKNQGILKSLEEEVLVNLSRSDFLCVIQRSETQEGKIQVPLIKRQNGSVFMPLFSDLVEMQKYTKGKPVRPMKIPFRELPRFLLAQANGFVINPMGFNLVLDRDTLQKLLGKA